MIPPSDSLKEFVLLFITILAFYQTGGPGMEMLPENLIDVHCHFRLQPVKTTPIQCSNPQCQDPSLAKTSQGSEFKFV